MLNLFIYNLVECVYTHIHVSYMGFSGIRHVMLHLDSLVKPLWFGIMSGKCTEKNFVLLKCKLHRNSKNMKFAEIFWARLHTLINGEWDLQNFRGGR